MSPESIQYLQPQLLETPRVVPESIPTELRELRQWVCWRYMSRGPTRKPDKQPVNAWNLHNAGVHRPNTWSTFAHAYTTYGMYREQGIAGIGFVLTPEDPFVGLDLDDCLRDEFIRDAAYRIITHLASYTEISPSGKGLRVIVNAAGFTRNFRTPDLEVYSHRRFLTLTGRHYASAPSQIRELTPDELGGLLPVTLLTASGAPNVHRSSQRRAYQQTGAVYGEAAPDQLWEHIFQHDQYGADHRQRFMGNTTLDRGDHSLSVLRLLNTLARWTDGNAAQMRAMMLLSPLANAKWFSKRGQRDWLDYQILDAIAFVQRGKA